MTVITGDVLDEKKKEETIPIPEAECGQDSLNLIPPKKPFVVRVLPKRRACSAPAQRLLALFISIAVLACSCIFGYIMFRHFFPRGHQGRYSGFCRVLVPEQHAQFRERFELDKESELMEIPSFDVYEGVTVLHLFGKRRTIIQTGKECYVKPMRHNLQPPANMDDMVNKFLSGEYLPSAHLISQRWYVKHPRIPNQLLGFILHPRAAKLCGDLPTYELFPRRQSSCPYIKCPIDCPHGYVHDYRGCATCECSDRMHNRMHPKSRCPGEPSVCRRFCRYGYEKGPGGCNRCKCRELAIRRKRSADNCDVRNVLFEGVAPGDETATAPINYIIDCKN